jgi:hypothetical protein
VPAPVHVLLPVAFCLCLLRRLLSRFLLAIVYSLLGLLGLLPQLVLSVLLVQLDLTIELRKAYTDGEYFQALNPG